MSIRKALMHRVSFMLSRGRKMMSTWKDTA